MPVIALSASSSKQLMPPFAERFIDPAQIEPKPRRRTELREAPHGTWKKVPDSTHLIADSQPDAVADAVFDLLDQMHEGPA